MAPRPTPPTPDPVALSAGRDRARSVRRALFAALAHPDPTQRRSLRDVLVAATQSTDVARTRLDQVLLAMPGIGPTRVAELFATARITPRRRVGGLLATTRPDTSPGVVTPTTPAPGAPTLSAQGQRLLALLEPTTRRRPNGWPYATPEATP